jgi:hypothetical protein
MGPHSHAEAAVPVTRDVLEEIREQNLGVYRAMPSRVVEDAAAESEIAANYQGRLVYELLQNADDAMLDGGGLADRILFRLVGDTLTVANSGRALTPEDVAGLCGIGATTKAAVAGRRASIGHKGMGFKSVLEITDRPETLSETYSFRLDAELSKPVIDQVLASLDQPPAQSVPTMRLPFPIRGESAFQAMAARGHRVVFRFPLRDSFSMEMRQRLADGLLHLPVTAILFLKQLEIVDVEVDAYGRSGRLTWEVKRERRADGAWHQVPGLNKSGVYRITITPTNGEPWVFIVAHDHEVDIGEDRGGLSGASWADVRTAEVSVATPWPLESDVSLPPDWARFHVFLPTTVMSPYSMLVNGAFRTDLARQHLPVGADDQDYNRHLLHRCAEAFRDLLLPVMIEDGGSAKEILSLLHARSQSDDGTGSEVSAVFQGAMKEAIGSLPFVLAEDGKTLAIREIVLPPLTKSEGLGADFRALLSPDATFAGRSFPVGELCDGKAAGALRDFGATVLTAAEAALVLAAADPERSKLEPHSNGRLQVDPVLGVLERLWYGLPTPQRRELETATRMVALLPVGADDSGRVRRVRCDTGRVFFPPRSLRGELPLQGLHFFLQAVCWGQLKVLERSAVLHDQLPAWHALFDVRDFKFPDVMRATVQPLLADADEGREESSATIDLESVMTLAAVCQLAGRTANADAPLPFERLGSGRQLFNLCRLPVPCRARDGEGLRWVPAYQTYFGRDWIGEASIEDLLDAMHRTSNTSPDLPIVAPPDVFLGALEGLRQIGLTPDEVADDEVDLDEDEEASVESDERDRWQTFLAWLGVNRVLRPIPFQDVDDRGTGWLTTSNLQRPRGHAFRQLRVVWDGYAKASGFDALSSRNDGGALYFYQLHDLDAADHVLAAACNDPTASVSRALYEHLARGWHYLEPHARATIADVPAGKFPSMRTPVRAEASELRDVADNLWMFRLRQIAWVPTVHGPRLASQAWLRSPEIQRRFGHRGLAAEDVVPVLDVSDALQHGRAAGLAIALGIRDQFVPAEFRPADARVILDRLVARFGDDIEADRVDERVLREGIRPAYRNVLELMSGSEDGSGEAVGPAPQFEGVQVLATDEPGRYRFVPASEAYYMSRPGTRDRLAAARIVTFVLVGSVSQRRALSSLGIRTLEDELRWTAKPGADALEEGERQEFQGGLAAVAPFILARLRTDRADERLAKTDASRLRGFVGRVVPVEELEVECRLGDAVLLRSGARDFYVSDPDNATPTAFVRWGRVGWPPSEREADALASLLVDALGVGAFEAFVTLIRSRDDDSRTRVLRLAGASTDVDEFRAVMATGIEEADSSSASATPLEIPRTVVHDPLAIVPEPLPIGDSKPASEPVTDWRPTIWRPDQLSIAGEPVLVRGSIAKGIGEDAAHRHDHGSADWEREGSDSGYGGHTDLEMLNAVGMSVALRFERHRLRLAGHGEAGIFGDDENLVPSVFDVSAPEQIERAIAGSKSFRDSFESLMRLGLDRSYPGFDIMTLRPDRPGTFERLIELKSSGVNARVQAMTWNEWKSARGSALREWYYLYLVGNLRSDLGDAVPYLRAIRDPFGTLLDQTITESRTTRAVRLVVDDFKMAEELRLEVRPDAL